VSPLQTVTSEAGSVHKEGFVAQSPFAETPQPEKHTVEPIQKLRSTDETHTHDDSPHDAFDNLTIYCIVLSTYAIVTIAVPLYLLSSFLCFDSLAKCYSHNYIYPATSGLFSIIFLCRPVLRLWRQTSKLERGKRETVQIIHFGAPVAASLIFLTIDYTVSQQALYDITPDIVNNDARLGEHLVNPTKQFCKYFEHTIQSNIHLMNWSTLRWWNFIGLFVESYSKFLILFSVTSVFFILPDRRHLGPDDEVDIAMLSFSVYFAMWWWIMRVTFLQHKSLLYNRIQHGPDFLTTMFIIFILALTMSQGIHVKDPVIRVTLRIVWILLSIYAVWIVVSLFVDLGVIQPKNIVGINSTLQNVLCLWLYNFLFSSTMLLLLFRERHPTEPSSPSLPPMSQPTPGEERVRTILFLAGNLL